MNDNYEADRIAKQIIDFLKTQKNSELAQRFYLLWQDALDFITYLELKEEFYYWSQDRSQFEKADKKNKGNLFPIIKLQNDDFDN